MSDAQLLSKHGCFGGEQRFYKHDSTEVRGPMRFGAYVPPQAKKGPVPVLYFLAGLTCTEETFCIKSHAQMWAAQFGVMLIAPDTSPREPRLPGDADNWDFGYAAGFYLDATQSPWAPYYRMESYVTKELPEVVAAMLPAKAGPPGLFGHSMGGHGALTLALRHPGKYKSLSAFAPIAAPMQVPWGIKAFTHYLGPDRSAWREHDATELVARRPFPGHILIDQGDADPFLKEQLKPEAFQAAAEKAGQKLTLRMQPGYDHGYYFMQTFMADHLKHHAEQL